MYGVSARDRVAATESSKSKAFGAHCGNPAHGLEYPCSERTSCPEAGKCRKPHGRAKAKYRGGKAGVSACEKRPKARRGPTRNVAPHHGEKGASGSKGRGSSPGATEEGGLSFNRSLAR